MSQASSNPAVPPDQMSLALERTYLAHERTLMAWTRTATSLITFGFTLYKFFEYLHDRGESVHQATGARTFGLVMIGIGVLTLIVASAQHAVQVRRLKSYYPSAPFSLALLLAVLIALLGTFGLVSGIMQSVGAKKPVVRQPTPVVELEDAGSR